MNSTYVNKTKQKHRSGASQISWPITACSWVMWVTPKPVEISEN